MSMNCIVIIYYFCLFIKKIQEKIIKYNFKYIIIKFDL